MRAHGFLLFLSVTVSVVGCSAAHGRFDDGGVSDAATCGGPTPFWCVSSCDSDALQRPTCEGGAWRCPPGTIDHSTCPPAASICPDGINPWDRSDPGSACDVEGATCTNSGGGPCGGGMFCTCESGSWNCAVAEPDPVCWCGREPSAGDPCNEEGSSCGQCCPTADGPNWPAMGCVDGRWQPTACPDVCPPVGGAICPADADAAVDTACTTEGQQCGTVCCGRTGITCRSGRWQRDVGMACACEPAITCGPGSCTAQQYCRTQCGPDDGAEYHCLSRPDGCDTCDCVPLSDSQACEMIDGHPYVTEAFGCG